ncbi:MAG: hypothetical protein SWY16_19195 [Cyanobacteriota bacterium]|nr:hypothetical protein [Cyanobacteriota bacterium]
MVNKESFVKQIYEDWGENPQSEVCVAILDYLLCSNSRNISHITYGSLRQVVGSAYSTSDILISVQYLCGDRTHLLDTKFELIENDYGIDISNSELKIAHKTGQLVHPETGELISNFEEKVYIYFQPSSLVKSII